MINPSSEACAAVKPSEPQVTVIPQESTIVGTFLAQLKLLLGVPEPVNQAFPSRISPVLAP